MPVKTNPLVILMADDDEDDCLLVKKALEQSTLASHLSFVGNGEELMNYLFHRGEHASLEKSPMPDLILLDLNMPRMNGLEALERIKSSRELRHIPVLILTTSRSDYDVSESYSLGANSFLTKPVNFKGLIDMMDAIKSYWFEVVELPKEGLVEENG